MIFRLLKIGGGRIGDDRGSVGVLVALVMFFVLGMLSMTYNTARLSTEKIRLQNAADAAALEHAAWQARGMNMIQNLNNEGFTGLCFADELICISCAFNVLREAFEIAGNVTPVPFNMVFKVLEVTLYGVIKAALFVAKWISRGLVGGVVSVLQTICQFTPIIGYMTAQELAQANGATPAGGASFEVAGVHFGAYAIGFAIRSPLTMFSLPVEREEFKDKEEKEKAPFITKNDSYRKTIEITNAASKRKELAKDVPEFDYKPMVSKKIEKAEGPIKWEMPSPVVWFCYRAKSEIRLAPLSAWDVGFDTKGQKEKKRFRLLDGHGGYGHMMALAAAQCITGDVVKQSVTAKKDSFCVQRPAGLGTGATAKLVPVASALSETFFGEFIYH